MPQAHAPSNDPVIYRPSREARRKSDGGQCPICSLHVHWKDLVVFDSAEMHVQCMDLLLAEAQ